MIYWSFLMDLTEFKSLYKYLDQMKVESKDSNLETCKNKEFYTFMAAVLQTRAKKSLLVRDFLDTDSTFGVISHMSDFTLREALDLYLDIKDVLESTTYAKVKNSGLITIHEGNNPFTEYTGFWVQIK